MSLFFSDWIIIFIFFLLLNIITSWPPHSLLLSPTPIEEHRWQSLSNRIAWNLPTSMSGINLVLTKRTYQHSTTEQPACPKTFTIPHFFQNGSSSTGISLYICLFSVLCASCQNMYLIENFETNHQIMTHISNLPFWIISPYFGIKINNLESDLFINFY